MSYFLAVDAGGTKTDYLLADESRVLASVRGGSIKRLRVSEDAAEENLRSCLQLLAQRSGVNMAHVAVTCIGAAGSNVPLVADWLRQAFPSQVGGTLILVGDVEIALDAAFFGGPGVLILAGTGSNVAGRYVGGQIITAGGWGPVLADQGSGFRLGHLALRECFLALDEGRKTILLDEILKFWGLANTEQLVEFANAEPWPDMSQLAVLVGRCASEGDATALCVIEQEAAALARLANVVIGRIKKEFVDDRTTEIAFTGSVIEHIPAMRQALIDQVMQSHPGVRPLPGVVVPLDGALWKARSAFLCI